MIAVVFSLASSAGAEGLLSYRWTQADAQVPVGQTHFNIWVHPREDVFMIQPGAKTVWGGGGHYPDPVWRTVAEAFVAPIGCTISDISPMTRVGATWHAHYACPAGVDLRALTTTQRDDLKRGAPLHP